MLAKIVANPTESNTRRGKIFSIQPSPPKSGVTVVETQPILVILLSPYLMRKVADNEVKA